MILLILSGAIVVFEDSGMFPELFKQDGDVRKITYHMERNRNVPSEDFLISTVTNGVLENHRVADKNLTWTVTRVSEVGEGAYMIVDVRDVDWQVITKCWITQDGHPASGTVPKASRNGPGKLGCTASVTR